MQGLSWTSRGKMGKQRYGIGNNRWNGDDDSQMAIPNPFEKVWRKEEKDGRKERKRIKRGN